MTDRVRSLTVVLEQDMREDDAKELCALIRNIRGVASVKIGPVVDFHDHIARQNARRLLGDKILKLITGSDE